MNYALPGLTAFLFTLAAIFFARRLFPRWGLVDHPERYGLTRKPIPYPGGVLLFPVFLLLSFLFLEPTLKLMGLLLGAGLLVTVNFIDDRVGLPAWFRLLIQVLVGIIMVGAGIGIPHISSPFGGLIPLDNIRFTLEVGTMTHTLLLFSSLFTVLWIVLIVNTLNWLDGIPGLVSGISFLGSLTLFFLSITDFVNQPDIATMAILTAGMALAFWLFDFHPPRILLGDSGSMFFGLLLAVMAIFSGGKIATAFLILGFAILDALYVVVYRLFKRRAPWKGGEWDRFRKAVHLHHRMLQAGFTERQVLLIIYLLSAVFGVTALLVGTRGKFWAIVVLTLASFILGLVLRARHRP